MRRDRLDIATAYAAPHSRLEELLCQILAEALELDVVGIDDDFFALGGDSPAAERLFVGIEVSTWMPLATVYDHPTARRLPELLSAGHLQPWPALVKLRGGGTQPASAVSHLGQLRRNVRAQADLRLDPDMRYLWSMPLVHARGGNRCIGCLLSRACPHCGSTSVNSERTAA